MRINLRESKGFSLVIVMVFVAMLSSLTIIAVKMGALTAISMYNAGEGKRAYYIAEAAFQHALFNLNQDPGWTGELLDQAFEGGTYSLNVSKEDPLDDITITAVGSYNGAEYSIVRIIPPPDIPFIIIAFAGTGVSGSSGDGGLALNARFNRPRGLAYDAAGNLYIADTSSHRIRKVDKVTEIVSKVAGTNQGFSGDNGLAVNARLNSPEGVTVDQSGNIYIADSTNCRIRKIDAATSIITTVAGTGTCGYRPGDENNQAINSWLNRPRDVVADVSGNFYIADTANCRIRKVSASDGRISTFAGGQGNQCGFRGDNGPPMNARLNRPRGLAFDASGNLYIADTINNRIRKIDMTANIITTIAGNGVRTYAGDDGPATAASLNRPQGVSINQFGTIYIADTDNHRIRKVDSSGLITTWTGNGTQGNGGDNDLAISANLNLPARVLSYDDVDGHIMISDTNNNRVREVTNVY